MTKLSLYRRALAIAVASALGVAAFAAWWSVDFRRILALIAALALGVAALVAMRGRLWRPLGLLTLGAAASFMAARGLLPWWALLPAAIGALGVALLGPGMVRRDRRASGVAVALAALFGVQIGAGVEEGLAWYLERPETLSTYEEFDELEDLDVFEEDDDIPDDVDPDVWRGREDAERDLRRGIFRELTYGDVDRAIQIYRDQLAVDGIRVEAVPSPIDTATVRYMLAYNEVMRAAIGQRFGLSYLDDQFLRASDALLLEQAAQNR